MQERITAAEFDGIWKKLRSQLSGCPTDPELEETRKFETLAALSHLSYEQVSDAVISYIESGETFFPTWGQILELVRSQPIETDPDSQPWSRREHPARTSMRGMRPEEINTPEYQALARAMDMDPQLMYHDWSKAKLRLWKKVPETSGKTWEQVFGSRWREPGYHLAEF